MQYLCCYFWSKFSFILALSPIFDVTNVISIWTPDGNSVKKPTKLFPISLGTCLLCLIFDLSLDHLAAFVISKPSSLTSTRSIFLIRSSVTCFHPICLQIAASRSFSLTIRIWHPFPFRPSCRSRQTHALYLDFFEPVKVLRVIGLPQSAQKTFP